ncbi:MAG: SDR family oxidoreductase [Chlorobium sp.]|nr:MAG: SDR family oxidoreductase [Chlorobium sp.]
MKKGVQIFSMKGKIALITGATGHLGSVMAYVLAEAGAHVLVNSRTEGKSVSLVKSLVASGNSAEPAVFDVTDEHAIRAFFSSYKRLSIDVLINNAYFGSSGKIEISMSENFADSYEVTVIAAHNLFKAALPFLRKAVQNNGDASVINLSSMYGMVSPNQSIYESAKDVNPPFYGAAKAALLQWSRYAACEFGPEGIRVNSVSPGPFPSDLVQASNPDFINKLAHKVPLGRIAQSDEIKGAILFLASSASSFVTGANIIVDGGWTCW